MTIDLLGWLDDPDREHGIRIADEMGASWTHHSYERLAGLVNGAAAEILEHGVRRHDVVALVLPTSVEFVAGFFGALAAGATPSALATPTVLDDPDEYVDHLAALLRAAQPGAVITCDAHLAVVAAAVRAAGHSRPPLVLSATERDEEIRRPRPDLALLQFTSGSTGTPRAVRIGWENVEANIEMVRPWLHMSRDDEFATWLPLYHDMGLIGCFLNPLMNGARIALMRPEHFIRDPMRWLSCMGRDGATLSCAPTFGFAYARKRTKQADLEGMDFSNWRAAVIAAERVDAAVMRQFIAHLRPYGLRETLFAPAYGLAESTLAVTGHPIDAVAPAIRPNWERLGFGEAVLVEDRAPVTDESHTGDGIGWIVSAGEPLPGVTVEIVGAEGELLPQGHLGEIVVHSSANARGYIGGGDETFREFQNGALWTGDAGFVIGGALYVVGRIGDALKVRGRMLYVEDLEARLAQVPDIDKGRCVVFAGREAAGDVLVALVEREPGEWCRLARRLLRRHVDDAVPVLVLSGERGAIARTSSGKPRRRTMWRRFAAGTLRAERVPEEQTEPAASSGAERSKDTAHATA